MVPLRGLVLSPGPSQTALKTFLEPDPLPEDENPAVAAIVPPDAPQPLSRVVLPSEPRARMEWLVREFLAGRKPCTLRAYAKDLEDFAAFCGARSREEGLERLVGLPQGEANAVALAYKNHLLERKLAPATVNRRLAALRSVVKVARIVGFVPWTLEVQAVAKEDARDMRGPTFDRVHQLLAYVDALDTPAGLRDAAMLHFLFVLGLRRAEVVGLDRKHVDLADRGVWVLSKRKRTRERRTIPTSAFLAVQAWIDVRGDGDGPLFWSFQSNHREQRLSTNGLYEILQRYSILLGIPRLRPHGLRHTAITEVLEKTDGNIRAAQFFSRHTSTQSLHRYDDARRDIGGEMGELLSNLVRQPLPPRT